MKIRQFILPIIFSLVVYSESLFSQVTATITDVINIPCFADPCIGSLTVTASGGTVPYTYLWDANAGNQTTASAINLCVGVYSVTVTDDIGITATTTDTVKVPNLLSVSIMLILILIVHLVIQPQGN
ncbi:MAG: hypothetical protein HY738_14300 [Bacteroidia bacterium]|nr:hypothetical protein [Bacteroidia bacterium]